MDKPVNTSIIEQAKDLAERRSSTVRNIRAKGVSFQLAQLALADVFTKRLVKLGSTVVQLEDRVLETQNLENLDPAQVLNLYHMASKSLMHASEYVQKVTNTVDWADLEAQIISLSEDQGQKVNMDVSRGAEYLLKRLAEMKLDAQKIEFPDSVVDAFKNNNIDAHDLDSVIDQTLLTPKEEVVIVRRRRSKIKTTKTKSRRKPKQ